jgi:hypothetical protein
VFINRFRWIHHPTVYVPEIVHVYSGPKRTQPVRNIDATIAGRYRSTGDGQSASRMRLPRVNRNCRMRSIFCRSGIVLGRPPFLGTIQAPALLDMARVCGNSGIGHTKNAVGYNAGHFEAVEVVKSHLR